ncbi:MAG: cytosine permease [Gammaproteobacteria bacterium]|nr:cytosine permease [Gammaproteobacteria bacterium]
MANQSTENTGGGAFTTYPLTDGEREWSFFEFTWVNVGLAIATWAFLIGGTTALFVGVRDGLAAIVIGNAIGVGIVALSTCQGTEKYGVEHYTLLRSVFGANGVRVVAAIALIVFGFGWTAVLGIMFGRATTNVSDALLGTNIGPTDLTVSLAGIVALGLAWAVLVRGPVSISWLNRIVGPGLVIVSLVLLYLIFAERSWGELLAAAPLDPFEGRHLNFLIAIELNLAAGLGWWPVMGNLSRLTKSARAATWPNLLGIGCAAAVGECVGLLAALTLASDDPTVWSIPIAGVLFGVFILLFIALANVTSIVSFVYSTALAARQAAAPLAEKIPWLWLTGLVLLPGAIGIFFPEQIYDNFFRFLAWTALAFAPLAGVSLADYMLRGRTLHVVDLYARAGQGRYAYWRGINFAAIGALVLGAITYVLLLNPQTLESEPYFVYFTASAPSCLVAGISYVLIMKLVLKPLGQGGLD